MTLVIVPVFMRSRDDFAVTLKTVESVRATDPGVELLLVDDCSPNRHLVEEIDRASEGLQFELRCNRKNEGFSRTVNVGLQLALDQGQDAVLLNADIEILTSDWSRVLAETPDSRGRPAAVVGCLLLYPGGELIQHAGVFFSFLGRTFDHRYRFGPGSLPEANRPWRCPVTGAFQFIRHSTLERVGVYDPKFRMAWEDVDYCLRTFQAGLECIYQPAVRAIHHESLFRGRADKKLTQWQQQSLARLMNKHRDQGFAEFVPEIV